MHFQAMSSKCEGQLLCSLTYIFWLGCHACLTLTYSSDTHAPGVPAALLQRVMSLTPQQIELLPPQQKAQVLALQQQLVRAGHWNSALMLWSKQ